MTTPSGDPRGLSAAAVAAIGRTPSASGGASTGMGGATASGSGVRKATSAEDVPLAVADEQAVGFLDAELARIATRFDSGELRAFGKNHEEVLRELTSVREAQQFLCVDHLSMEMETVRKEDQDDGATLGSTQEFERMTKQFREKEQSIAKMMERLRELTQKLDAASQ